MLEAGSQSARLIERVETDSRAVAYPPTIQIIIIKLAEVDSFGALLVLIFHLSNFVRICL